jgi:hypothetical protein
MTLYVQLRVEDRNDAQRQLISFVYASFIWHVTILYRQITVRLMLKTMWMYATVATFEVLYFPLWGIPAF